MFGVENFVEAFKIIATVAIFFVWFVRYDNIKKEFLNFCNNKNYHSTFAFLQILSFFKFQKIFRNTNKYGTI